MCWSKNAICSCAASIGVLAVASPIARSSLDETLVRDVEQLAIDRHRAKLGRPERELDALERPLQHIRACFCTSSVAASMASSRRGDGALRLLLEIAGLAALRLVARRLFRPAIWDEYSCGLPLQPEERRESAITSNLPGDWCAVHANLKKTTRPQSFGAAQAKPSARQSFATWATASARYFR